MRGTEPGGRLSEAEERPKSQEAGRNTERSYFSHTAVLGNECRSCQHNLACLAECSGQAQGPRQASIQDKPPKDLPFFTIGALHQVTAP